MVRCILKFTSGCGIISICIEFECLLSLAMTVGPVLNVLVRLRTGPAIGTGSLAGSGRGRLRFEIRVMLSAFNSVALDSVHLAQMFV